MSFTKAALQAYMDEILENNRQNPVWQAFYADFGLEPDGISGREIHVDSMALQYNDDGSWSLLVTCNRCCAKIPMPGVKSLADLGKAIRHPYVFPHECKPKPYTYPYERWPKEPKQRHPLCELLANLVGGLR